jgi:nucleoside-diphosphate-sugar epimerase
VEDISRAFLEVLTAERALVHDQAFNVGRDEDVVQVRTIAEAVAERTGAPVTLAEGASADKRDYRVDFGKIRRLLPAFAPAWTVARGIDQLVGDMGRNQLTAEQFANTFVRLVQVQRHTSEGVVDEMLHRRELSKRPV